MTLLLPSATMAPAADCGHPNHVERAAASRMAAAIGEYLAPESHRVPIVPVDHVPQETRMAAAVAMAYATEDLALPPVRLIWFEYPETPFSSPEWIVDGFTPFEPPHDRIYIRCACRPAYATKTPEWIPYCQTAKPPLLTVAAVLHEARHVRQLLDGTDGDEAEAFAYGKDRTYGRSAARFMEEVQRCIVVS